MAGCLPNSQIYLIFILQKKDDFPSHYYSHNSVTYYKFNLLTGQVIPHCCMAHHADIPQASVDIVLVWVALHDMYNPSEVLDTVRPLLKPEGCVLVLEFANPDNFSELMAANPESPEVAQMRGQTQFCLSVSTLHCLPVSKTEDPSQVIS